jgi:hypothetical protein
VQVKPLGQSGKGPVPGQSSFHAQLGQMQSGRNGSGVTALHSAESHGRSVQESPSRQACVSQSQYI